MNKTEILAQRGAKVVMNTYSRFPIAFDHGQGVYAWDMDGKKYLDFVAGIAVNSLGYSHPKLCAKISEQCQKLMHVSNLYYTEPQIELAELLTANSCFDKVFFCNSGAESIESMLKLARKYAVMKNKPGRDIIAMEKSFHGRTYGAVTATGQDKYHKGLDPMLPGIKHVPYNDFEALLNAVDENTCAILMEPIQGEGGIRPADKEYLLKVRALCDEKDILLIFDEVQCGVGRTGYLFAYQAYGVEPDGACFAKGLAGGLPIGACLANEKCADVLDKGTHGSTFGGNPAVCAGALSILKRIDEALLAEVREKSDYIVNALTGAPGIKSVTGMGLMLGVETEKNAKEVVARCMENSCGC